MKERIISLLGTGISPAIAASAVGCSEAYVSQLMSQPEIAERVSALRFESLQAASNHDKKLDSLEDKIVDRLGEALPMMMRPAELLRAAAIINGMKRRGSSAPETVHIQNQIVNLQIPQHAAVRFQLSSTKEIVEVDGRSLVTMPASQLLLEAKRHATDKLPGETVRLPEDKQAA
jgi:hypothetical protein